MAFLIYVLKNSFECIVWTAEGSENRRDCVSNIFLSNRTLIFILGPPSNVFFSTSAYFVNGNT